MNTLKCVKSLEGVGFSREQAEMTMGILNEVVESKLATKQDLRELKSELMIKLGAMMISGFAISVAIISALVKLA